MGNFNLDVTLKKAVASFQEKKAEEMMWKSGAHYEEGRFSLVFMDSSVQVLYPQGMIKNVGLGDEASLTETEQILVLHYLTYAQGTPLSGKKISYQEVPGGSIYLEPFRHRSILPMTALFGQNLEAFQAAAEKWGAVKESYGDMSFTFYPLPRIPVTLVLWAGDEEFPASGTILFDASAGDYLPAEDYAFICSMLVGRLKAFQFNNHSKVVIK